MFTRRQLLYGTGVAGLAIAVCGCSGGPAHAEELHGTTDLLSLPWDDTPHVPDAARASARIAWQVMIADKHVRTKNAAMSPSSLAVTLAMLAEGAAGASLTSLDEAFGLTGDDRSAAVGALRQALATYEDLPKSVDADEPPKTPVVHQANRVVILDDAEVSQDFLDRLASYYDTSTTRIPLAEAKADLDAWANKNTAGLIKETAIDLNPDIRLITQDALLFAARWRQEFKQDKAQLNFTTGEGETADLDALSDTFTVPYATGVGWEAVRLPYDDALTMDVIVPERGVHPSELDFDAIDASVHALAEAGEATVKVTMPPSDITAKWSLLQPLRDQGINLTDLSGIFPDAFASQVAQQVKLTVTAKGTVGAALTEVAIPVSAPSVLVDIVVDRPFVMRVLDIRTGWPQFLAIVNDPAAILD